MSCVLTEIERNTSRLTSPKGPSTQYSYASPKPALELLLPNTQVPNHWALGHLGFLGFGDLRKFEALSKVACAQQLGARSFALRFW